MGLRGLIGFISSMGPISPIFMKLRDALYQAKYLTALPKAA
jgi:hypothetical protein